MGNADYGVFGANAHKCAVAYDAEKAQPRFAQYGGNDAHNAASFPVYRLYIARRRCVLLGVLVTYRRGYTGVQQFYGPQRMLARERVKELTKECDFEALQMKKAEQAVLNGEKTE